MIIGQAPGRQGTGEPLSGKAGRRLAALCGLDLDAYLARFQRVNLLPVFPGKAGKGDRFPLPPAREAARALLPTLEGRRVVLLGGRVAAAFGLHRAPRDLGGCGSPPVRGQPLVERPAERPPRAEVLARFRGSGAVHVAFPAFVENGTLPLRTAGMNRIP